MRRVSLALALVLAAASAAWAAKLGAAVRAAIGGSSREGEHALQRPYRDGAKKLGDGDRLKVTSVGQRVGYLDAAHYQNVRDVGVKLLKKFPPDEHFFIGVGRSPVALVTFLRELDDRMAMTFPASDMRLEIQRGWRKEYFAHFAALIPKSVLEGERAIVLFDRTREGKTLARLRNYLRAYLKSVGSKTEVKIIGLSPQRPTSKIKWMNTSAYPNLFKYQLGQYDHDEAVAPFEGKHRIGVDAITDLKLNRNHGRFRKAMRARMAEDATLDGILAKDFKEHVR